MTAIWTTTHRTLYAAYGVLALLALIATWVLWRFLPSSLLPISVGGVSASLLTLGGVLGGGLALIVSYAVRAMACLDKACSSRISYVLPAVIAFGIGYALFMWVRTDLDGAMGDSVSPQIRATAYYAYVAMIAQGPLLGLCFWHYRCYAHLRIASLDIRKRNA